METKHKKMYTAPDSKALELKMKATLLTGSDVKGNRNLYNDGGEYTWN